MYRVLTCLAVDHDWRLVLLAAAICLFASAVAVSLFHRAGAAAGRARLAWLALDATVGGCGIWATHFVAMLAYDAGAEARYDIPVTVASLVAAVAISGLGLGAALYGRGRSAAAAGGAVLGGGIAAMHYAGMAALEVPARLSWDPVIVAASIAVGAAFAAAALVAACAGERLREAGAATALLTLGIVSHHFTGMGAVTLTPDPSVAVGGVAISPSAMSALIAVATFAVLGISLIAAMVDRHADSQILRQKMVADAALENMSQGLCMFDAQGRVVMHNERFLEIMGIAGAYVGRHFADLLCDLKRIHRRDDGDPAQNAARMQAESRAGLTKVIELSGRSIRVVHAPMRGGGWVATFEDITEWQRAQDQISHMALHDALTDLPNRTLFRDRLAKGVRLTGRDERLAVLCLDLDRFKEINDTLGHPVGDALLREVASRLTESVGEGTVARIGGDEFAVVKACAGAPAVSGLAQRLVESLAEPFEIAGHHLAIGVSIGVSLSPDDGTDPDELLKMADLALYRAKADGRGTFRFFEPGMDARAQARRLLERDLRTALTRDEFEVYYQPIRDISRDRLVAFEALVRWNHPLRGLIAPDSFIPLAEETGLIVAVGEIVLRRACADATAWPADVSVAVNLSPLQFKSPSLTATVKAALAEAGLSPRRLELEITESVLLQNSEATLATLHDLRGHGVRISLDDFGTGYSSLSYLRSFPFDKIKIDRSFVKELGTCEESKAIVRAVTGLGKSLGIVTTAEGVETPEQLGLLAGEGCTQAQGYLFSKPRPASEVAGMLDRRQSAA